MIWFLHVRSLWFTSVSSRFRFDEGQLSPIQICPIVESLHWSKVVYKLSCINNSGYFRLFSRYFRPTLETSLLECKFNPLLPATKGGYGQPTLWALYNKDDKVYEYKQNTNFEHRINKLYAPTNA